MSAKDEMADMRRVEANAGRAGAAGIAVICAFFAFLGVNISAAGPTVNWLDPLGYQKPQAVALNEPNEATVANKYWIDLSSGSGTTCSQASPCRSFDDVLGKPGTIGGPAVLYVKGTGGMSWFDDAINGSGNLDCRTAPCSNWILVRPWPAGSPGCAAECTATITGSSNVNSTELHHIMFDGGPDLKIRFDSNGGAGTYAMHIQANYITIYRTQMYCTGSNAQLGWAVSGFAVSDHVSFINNEFYGCAATGDQASAVYVGPGTGGGYTNFLFQNNIVRDFYGEGLEINPRVTSSNATIIGNAIHNVGKGTCGSRWNCRPGITMSIQSGGGNNGTVIANNLMWDTGSGCIWERGGGIPQAAIYNNTCFDYAKGNANGEDPNPQGISGWNNGGTAIVRNNIIYAPNRSSPFDGSAFVVSNNLCGATFFSSFIPFMTACGPSSLAWSANTVLSTDPNSTAFMQIGPASEARNRGLDLASVNVVSSYGGGVRPQEGAYDIGAFEYGAGPFTLSAPTNLRVVR